MKKNLLNAIHLARKIHASTNLYGPGGTVVQVVPNVMDYVSEHEMASDDWDKPPRKRKKPHNIEIAKLELPTESRGLAEIGDDKSRILVSPDLSTCWTRFTIVKELMQIYTERDSLDNARDILNSARESRAFFHANVPENESQVVSDELFCLFLAMELMLPWKHRSMIDQLRKSDPLMSIAKRFMVPLAIVEDFFEDLSKAAPRDKRSYSGLSFEINREKMKAIHGED